MSKRAPRSIVDKPAPHDLDAEMAVLGCGLLDKEALYKITDYLTETSFYHRPHQLIFAALLKLTASRMDVDFNTVVERLRAMNVLEEAGGAVYLTDLIDRVSTTAHVDSYIHVLRDKHIRRVVLGTAAWITGQVHLDVEHTGDALLEQLSTKLLALQHKAKARAEETPDMRADLEAMTKQIESLWAEKQDYTVGLNILDDPTLIEPETLIVIGGWPSHGKSVLVMQMALQMIEQGIPAIVFSTEMSRLRLIRRAVSYHTGIPNTFFRRRRGFSSEKQKQARETLWPRIAEFCSRFYRKPITLIDRQFSPSDVRLAIRSVRDESLKAGRDGMVFVVIDAFQDLVTVGHRAGETRHELDEWLIQFNDMVRETGCCLALVSHLTKLPTIERPPTEGDLKETGMIAHKADKVVLTYYQYRQKPTIEQLNTLSMLLAKDKEGMTIGWRHFYFRPELSRLFDDKTDYDQYITAKRPSQVELGLDGKAPNAADKNDEEPADDEVDETLPF